MSLRGRKFFDALQHKWLSSRFALPRPPYDKPEYWDRVYRDLDAADVREWGDFDLERGLRGRFRCETVLHWHGGGGGGSGSGATAGGRPREERGPSSPPPPREHETTLAECLDVRQWQTPEDALDRYNERATAEGSNEAILLLGCGTSRMGEQMLRQSFEGPVVQLDVSPKAIELLTRRYQKYLEGATTRRMEFVVDDARGLTALGPASIGGGVLDKGLIDDLHVADRGVGLLDDDDDDHHGDGGARTPAGGDDDDVRRIADSVHRLLRPGRPFAFFSRSGPEYVLRRTLGSARWTEAVGTRWRDVRVLELAELQVLLYRFVKAEEDAAPEEEAAPRIRPRRKGKRRRP